MHVNEQYIINVWANILLQCDIWIAQLSDSYNIIMLALISWYTLPKLLRCTSQHCFEVLSINTLVINQAN